MSLQFAEGIADVLLGGEGPFGMFLPSYSARFILDDKNSSSDVSQLNSPDVNVKVGSLKFAIHDSKYERAFVLSSLPWLGGRS